MPLQKVVTLRTYEDKTNHFEAKVDIPEIDSAPEAVNRSIEDYANELIAQYEKDLRASQGEGNYSLTSTYKVVTDTDRYLCLRIDTTLVMASGTEYTKVFTIDKTTGDIISLSDLFKNQTGNAHCHQRQHKRTDETADGCRLLCYLFY